jgi:hypothetical protein
LLEEQILITFYIRKAHYYIISIKLCFVTLPAIMAKGLNKSSCLFSTNISKNDETKWHGSLGGDPINAGMRPQTGPRRDRLMMMILIKPR